MGIGYCVGIYDSALIRKSFRNLGIASVVSLLISALYFFASPLNESGSELLGRTYPTIWDVLIALFGGLAGVIGATRRERTNVVSGVAIATALMPPLCTAGYGLTTGNPEFFFGAIYLFAINCVFIAFSTVVIIWLIKAPHEHFVDARNEVKVRRYLTLVVFVTVLPSCYIAYQLVRNELFKGRAKELVKQELTLKGTHVAETNVDPASRSIEVTVVGDVIRREQVELPVKDCATTASKALNWLSINRPHSSRT